MLLWIAANKKFKATALSNIYRYTHIHTYIHIKHSFIYHPFIYYININIYKTFLFIMGVKWQVMQAYFFLTKNNNKYNVSKNT